MTETEAEDIAQRVFDKLRAGLLALPPDVVGHLKEFGGYFCPPTNVGYGPNYYTLNCVVNKDGSLFLQLRDPFGNGVWQGVLTA